MDTYNSSLGTDGEGGGLGAAVQVEINVTFQQLVWIHTCCTSVSLEIYQSLLTDRNLSVIATPPSVRPKPAEQSSTKVPKDATGVAGVAIGLSVIAIIAVIVLVVRSVENIYIELVLRLLYL